MDGLAACLFHSDSSAAMPAACAMLLNATRERQKDRRVGPKPVCEESRSGPLEARGLKTLPIPCGRRESACACLPVENALTQAFPRSKKKHTEQILRALLGDPGGPKAVFASRGETEAPSTLYTVEVSGAKLLVDRCSFRTLPAGGWRPSFWELRASTRLQKLSREIKSHWQA